MSKKEGWPTKSAILRQHDQISPQFLNSSSKGKISTINESVGIFINENLKKNAHFGKNSRFGHTSFIKVLINGTIVTDVTQYLTRVLSRLQQVAHQNRTLWTLGENMSVQTRNFCFIKQSTRELNIWYFRSHSASKIWSGGVLQENILTL